MFNYFAYGSVISLAHAREWCQSHALDVTPFLAGEPARLDGYRLVFDVPSRFWSGLVADIVPDPQSHVEGVLFTLDDSARIAVMRKEGVATGLYRESVEDVTVGDRKVKASIFLAETEKRVAVGPASFRYAEALVEGAAERGLTPEWRTFLSKISRDSGKPPPPGVSLGLKR
jgi:cation transport regulator ChaC